MVKTLFTRKTTARVRSCGHQKVHLLFPAEGRLWWWAFLGIAWSVVALPTCSKDDHSKGSSFDTDSTAANDDTDSTAPEVPTGTEGGHWSDLDGEAAPAHTSPEAENSGIVTQGGTITFTHIGAPGYWGRRIEAEEGDDRCDVQAETINYSWGGSEFCCRTTHEVTSDHLTPFNEQLTMVIEGPLKVKQLAVYQPLEEGGSWGLRSYWDRDSSARFNIQFVGPGDTADFDGILGNNCAFHAMQEKPFSCGPGSVPYCPGSGLDFEGWAGSKLFVSLAAMPYTQDPELLPKSCIAEGEDEREQDAPWIGLSASELIRDGWAGYLREYRRRAG